MEVEKKHKKGASGSPKSTTKVTKYVLDPSYNLSIYQSMRCFSYYIYNTLL